MKTNYIAVVEEARRRAKKFKLCYIVYGYKPNWYSRMRYDYCLDGTFQTQLRIKPLIYFIKVMPNGVVVQ